jgi:hypothetical protein
MSTVDVKALETYLEGLTSAEVKNIIAVEEKSSELVRNEVPEAHTCSFWR